MIAPASVDPAFWRGKRVLLTGHTGFKGSWLALWLQSMGVTLRGLALRPPTDPALFDVARVHEGMEHRLTDLRDLGAVETQLREFAPEIVIHLAAQSLVRRSYRDPVETYATNVMGTVHLLEAARRCGSVVAIVVVTSDKCYEPQAIDRGYHEHDPMGGHDPYASSKGCAELVSAAYRRAVLADAGIALATVRAGNVIGGGDWAHDRLVPDVLRAWETGAPVPLRYPQATRPWQQVLDPLAGYLLLAERLVTQGQAVAEGWNFGPADADVRPVAWVVEQLAASWGPGATWVPQTGDHPHEAATLRLDSTKARARLGWAPRGTLTTALQELVDWHRAWRDGQEMRAVSLAQLARYGART